VPHSESAPALLQIRVGPIEVTNCRSVVRSGIVQLSVTALPLRAARRSLGGFGNSSEGGNGGPIDAQPANISGKHTGASSLSTGVFMQEEKD